MCMNLHAYPLKTPKVDQKHSLNFTPNKFYSGPKIVPEASRGGKMVETKKILDYCNLPWEDNCLDFSNNKTPIKTASVGQARSKIYSTSVKSSTKYEIYLKELFNLLQKKSPS